MQPNNNINVSTTPNISLLKEMLSASVLMTILAMVDLQIDIKSCQPKLIHIGILMEGEMVLQELLREIRYCTPVFDKMYIVVPNNCLSPPLCWNLAEQAPYISDTSVTYY